MGCDVHPVIQIDDSNGYKDYHYWKTVAIPDRSRCYALFGALAGVRCDGPPIVQPRGLPEDCKHAKADDPYPLENLSFEHTPTWFTLTEAEAYNAEWLKTVYEDSDSPWQQWRRWLKTANFFREMYGLTSEQVRFVMDFDS